MKNTKKPLVSIVLSVYNARETLGDSLKSLLSQTYKNIEIIAVDDHSSDASYALLRKIAQEDKRLRIIRNKKRYGLSVCLNRAFAKTKGMYLAFADPEAKSKKERIKKQLDFLLANPKVAVVGTQCEYFDEKEKRIGQTTFPATHEEIKQNLITGLSMEFETALINKYLIPKDVLQLLCVYSSFATDKKKSVYADVLIKLIPYGEFANIKTVLQARPKQQIKSSSITQIANLLKLWVKSITIYETRLPLRTLFSPLIKQA